VAEHGGDGGRGLAGRGGRGGEQPDGHDERPDHLAGGRDEVEGLLEGRALDKILLEVPERERRPAHGRCGSGGGRVLEGAVQGKGDGLPIARRFESGHLEHELGRGERVLARSADLGAVTLSADSDEMRVSAKKGLTELHAEL